MLDQRAVNELYERVDRFVALLQERDHPSSDASTPLKPWELYMAYRNLLESINRLADREPYTPLTDPFDGMDEATAMREDPF